MNNKNEIRLYNVIFPIWLLWLVPITWIVVIPANLLIDFLVLYFTIKHLGLDDPKLKAKSVLLRSWICGFISDFIGMIGMYLALYIDFDYENNQTMYNWWMENIQTPVAYNPFESILGFLWVTVCVLIAAGVIYLLNYRFCLRKLDADKKIKQKIALSMAVFTAPYLYYLPTALFY